MPGPLSFRSPRFASFCVAVAAFAGLSVALPTAVAQSPAAVERSAQILSPVDASVKTQLSGHMPVFADTARLQSTAMPNGATFARLTLVLNRAPEVEAAFDQLLADQQNPSSPRYHQWLLPAQVGELYGPAQADVNAVTNWLQSQGMKIVDISPSRTLITFSGTESAVAAAFSTSFRLFNLANGETRYSLLQEPSVPSPIAPVVKAVQGLSQVIHTPNVRHGKLIQSLGADLEAPLLNSSTGNHYLVAGDFATAYDINSVYSAGYTGTGQNIAIAGESRVDAADITTLQSIQGQTPKLPTTYIPPTGVDPGTIGDSTGKDSGEQDEATLDVDRTTGNAPGATIDLVVSGDVNGGNTYATQGLFIAINYAISTLNDPILSISFGGCENLNGQQNTVYERSIFQTAASQGISTFISSGDDGAASCNAFSSTIPSPQIASINDLCAGEFVTCLGGTEFADSTNASTYWASSNSKSNGSSLLSYIPEGAWNDVSVSTSGTYSYGATGGGSSVYIARPSFQTGNGVPAGAFRLVPDIALTSSTHDGFVTCLSYLGATCGSFYAFGGTSAAAPSMAAIQALANQKLGGRQGNINPKIYSLAASTPNVFHDVTVASSGVSSCSAATESLCNNSTPSQTSATGLAGYVVNAGYDEVTGWGSIDVANYLAAVATNPYFTITPSTPTVSSTPGATTTQSVTITSGGGYSGTVILTCTIAQGASGSCTVAPTSVLLTSLGSATTVATITTSSSSTGNVVATITGTGTATGSTFSTTAFGTVTIALATPTLSIATPAALSFTSGARTGNTETVSFTSSDFVGNVALACSISTSTAFYQPSCTISPASVPVSGTTTASAVVTISSTTTVTVTQSRKTLISGLSVWSAAIALLIFCVPIRRRRAFRALAMLLLASGLAVMSGCGAGGSAPGVSATHNSAGTYTVTVNGVGTTSAGSTVATASRTFTVTIN